MINNLVKIKFTPVRILAIGFGLIILSGAMLLTLPIASALGEKTPFIDALFMSASAVCVTGLTTLDTGVYWSYFGKTIIIVLIQIGGLGFMSFATLIAVMLGKKITLRERLVMQEAMSSFGLQGLIKLARYIIIFTFVIEGIGATLLATRFIPEFGFKKGVYYSIFHVIAAFCNSGVDLLGDFKSLMPYYDDITIILTISALIIVGGLGFPVWHEIYVNKRLKRMSLHSKVALLTTVTLIVLGTILIFLFEYNNLGTMGSMNIKDKLLSSFFSSVSLRTAGYSSISVRDMTMAGIFLTTILMFIGGSPGSTAGGIKTTTLATILFTIVSFIKGKDDTEILKKRVAKDSVHKAFIVSILGFILVTVVTMILSLTEKGVSFQYLLYEATSAFGTTGLTLGLTTELSFIGKCIILITMYLGRLGPIMVVLSVARNTKANPIKYPEDKILIG